MSSNQRLSPISLGFFGPATGSTPAPSTTALSAAATWLAISFSLPKTLTLARLKIYCTAVTGSLAGTDLTADIYSDAANLPNASIVSSATLTSAITASTWAEFGGASTGFNTSLTGGNQYWAVFKNLNAVPASNFPTFQFGTNNPASSFFTGAYGWTKKHTTNSGSTWVGGTSQGTYGLRLEFTDGSFSGLPFQNSAVNGSALGVYATREYGSKFTSPSNAILQVAGLFLFVGAPAGTPTQPGRLGLWTGTSPVNLAYTNSIPVTSMASASWLTQYFSATQTIQPGTVCRVTLGEVSQADSSSNRYNALSYTIENDANSKALMPIGGTMQQTYFNGSTWADTDTAICPCGLLLDTEGQFGAVAGGSAVLIGG